MDAGHLLGAAMLTLLTASCSSSSTKSEATSTSDSKSETTKSTAAPSASATSRATASAAASAKPTAEAAATVSASAPNAPSAVAAAADGEGVHALAHGVLIGVPTERSKIPTFAEWSAAKDIKGIPGNGGDLSECEIRAVREWLRISCRPFGGPETGTALPRVEADKMEVNDGKDGEVLTFAKGGIASVVFPLLDGKHREFTVSYGNAYAAKHIVLDWPHGAPGPTLRFGGAG